MDLMSLKLKSACLAGDIDEVKRLLDSSADPNSTDETGSGTLLTFEPAMIEYLVSRGADPNIQTNENGASALAGLAFVNQIGACGFCSGQGPMLIAGVRNPARRHYTTL
jgi:ankyrin repeat protein